MNASLVIMEFIPLIVYIGVDAWKGFRAGIIAAIICTLLMIAYEYFIFDEIDQFILGEGIMIVVLGMISLKMNNDRYFKFQPTVLAAVFTGVFAWFQIFSQPLLLHFVPHMEKLLQTNPDTLQMLHSTQFQSSLARLSGHMIWLFLIHGLIMAYAALRLRTSGWFAWRLAIYPALLVLVVINQFFA